MNSETRHAVLCINVAQGLQASVDPAGNICKLASVQLSVQGHNLFKAASKGTSAPHVTGRSHLYRRCACDETLATWALHPKFWGSHLADDKAVQATLMTVLSSG